MTWKFRLLACSVYLPDTTNICGSRGGEFERMGSM